MEPVAIIGMSGRFPGANDISQFWSNLCNGVESISSFSPDELVHQGIAPALIGNPNYVNARGVLDGIEMFDARLFGYSPRSAEQLDPQQRVFLECAWEALEHAGYDPDRYQSPIAVFAGCSSNGYVAHLSAHIVDGRPLDSFEVTLGNEKDSLSLRAAYKLNLCGPAITVQTLCSTSLVAVALACRSLKDGDCSMALAGGVSINVPHRTGYLYEAGAPASPDGHCRTFDESAAGTVPGSGAGVVVLKRLSLAIEERDQIEAVILSTAIGNDGANRIGFTAPGPAGQARNFAAALTAADVLPEEISFIECHGTGTRLGDPIEVDGLAQVFGRQRGRPKWCALGAVKTNIGHLDSAAGIAGLIKTALALKHQRIPPTLHFRNPHPDIDLDSTPFFVNVQLQDWTRGGTPRLAAVASFGMGGTNAHAIVSEAPPPAEASEGRSSELVVLSAATSTALDRTASDLSKYFAALNPVDFSDAAFTLQVGRREQKYRRILQCKDPIDAARALAMPRTSEDSSAVQSKQRPVAFLLPGQGAQHVGMAQELLATEPAFRRAFERCATSVAERHGLDLRDLIFRTPSTGAEHQLRQTTIAQPALFAIEFALASLWLEWEAQPVALLGHSLGEIVAACIAEVMSLDDALEMVVHRGRLMQSCEPGAMTAVSLSSLEILGLLGAELELAAVNARGSTTVAGSFEAMETFEGTLRSRGIAHRRLETSHAFHSRMMEPAVDHFGEIVAKLELRSPKIPIVSNVTGTWLTPEQAKSPNYWAEQLRRPVRFADGLSLLARELDPMYLEVGPGNVLSGLARKELGGDQVIVSSLPHSQAKQSAHDHLWAAAGRMWLAGQQINWERARSHEGRRRLHLPTYPFERQRYWIDAPRASVSPSEALPSLTQPVAVGGAEPSQSSEGSQAAAVEALAGVVGELIERESSADSAHVPSSDGLEEMVTATWKACLGVSEVSRDSDVFELGGDSLVLIQIAARVRQALGRDIPMRVFFSATTISQLTTAIRAHQEVDTSDMSNIAALLDRVEHLSDAEVDSALTFGARRAV